MSDIETEKFRQIGIDLINEYRQQRGIRPIQVLDIRTPEINALIRSIQLHEATKQELADCKQEFDDFRQEVSDAAQEATEIIEHWSGDRAGAKCLQDFIIPKPKPKPKPDPLVDVAESLGFYNTAAKHWAGDVRAALEARGLEIREKNDD